MVNNDNVKAQTTKNYFQKDSFHVLVPLKKGIIAPEKGVIPDIFPFVVDWQMFEAENKVETSPVQ